MAATDHVTGSACGTAPSNEEEGEGGAAWCAAAGTRSGVRGETRRGPEERCGTEGGIKEKRKEGKKEEKRKRERRKKEGKGKIGKKEKRREKLGEF
jgi:hypothetical protein